MDEAVALLQSGSGVDDINKAMKAFGMPVGR
jgi:hypothetical protein